MNYDLISRKALKMVIEHNQLVNAKLSIYDVLKIIDNAPTRETTIEELISTLSVEELKATTWFKVDTPSGEAISFRREKTGHWIEETDEHLKGMYRCSVCGRRVEDLTDDVNIHIGWEDCTVADIYPFCHCGADMRKEKRE